MLKAMVLAAGNGERLRPVTDALPKPLVPIVGVPLIRYPLELLAHFDVQHVGVNVFRHADTMEARLPAATPAGTNLQVFREESLLGTGGGLRNAREFLGGDTFVVLNGDAIVDIDLHMAVGFHRASGAIATMVVRRHPRVGALGEEIWLDAGGHVAKIGKLWERAGAEDGPYAFVGAHVMQPGVFEFLPKGPGPSCIVRQGYVPMLSMGLTIAAFKTEGYFADIGTPARFHTANMDVLSGKAGLSYFDPLGKPVRGRGLAEYARYGDDLDVGAGARFAPPVVIADRVRVGAASSLGPYAIVGEDVEIAPGSKVRNSVVLPGTTLEDGEVLDLTVACGEHRLKVDSSID